MDSKKRKSIDRRNFLKSLGVSAAATTVAFYGCKPKTEPTSGTNLGEVPTDKMEYRTNPHTGDKVSLLGYGCMRWPLRQKADGSGEEIDQDAVNDLVDYAIAHGVNYFDTSPAYVRGQSETATGIALKRHARDKFLIATKMSNFAESTHSRQASIDLYHNSLKTLQVDYLDYYLLHGIGMGGMDAFRKRFLNNGILDFLLEERKKEKIRNLGFSYHGEIEVFDYLLAQDIQWDFVQIQLNYVDWKHASGWNTNAEYLYGELIKRNIPAVIMEPLLGGRLSKLPEHILSELKQKRPEDSAATWAFRYAGSPKQVLTVLSGMVYMEHLQENIRTYSPLQPITQEEYPFLEDVAQRYLQYPLVNCTECQYCMPCPYGINIPGVFAQYNRCVNEGNIPKSSQDEDYRRTRRAFLIEMNRNLPKERQFSHCIGCGICLTHCPQRIKIPEEMARIDKLTEQLKQELAF